MGGEWVKKTPQIAGSDPGKSEMNEYSNADYARDGGDMWEVCPQGDYHLWFRKASS